MKKLIALSFWGFIMGISHGQIVVPYSNHFDASGDTIGWSHYALSGTDDWELGVPDGSYFLISAYSLPNAWATKLDSLFISNSDRALETPWFDLSDTTIEYVFSFYQSRHSNEIGGSFVYAEYYVEYLTGQGTNWLLLNDDSTRKKNWQDSTGFSDNAYLVHSAINIRFLQGQDSLKFRFRMNTPSQTYGDGWMIDHFSIREEYYNYYATQGDSIFINKHCPVNVQVTSTLGFDNQYGVYYPQRTNYYFSYDSLLDSIDVFLGANNSYSNIGSANYTKNVNLPGNLPAGNYYVLYEHDALDSLVENNESDNIGFAVVRVDSVFDLPYVDDFENVNQLTNWKSIIPSNNSNPSVWQLGRGYLHHIEASHSGTHAWHTSETVNFDPYNCGTSCNTQYIESPYVDLTSISGNLVFNVWFKSQTAGWNSYDLEYISDCGQSGGSLYSFPAAREDEWDFLNVPLTSLSSIDNVKFRIKFESTYLGPEGIIFDDIYIGPAKPDLSIERDLTDRFSSSLSPTYSLQYFLTNSGLSTAGASNTSFYWSTDSILDSSDILLGIKQEPALADTARIWTNFTFTKPSSTTGIYYIFYDLDTDSSVNEMREYNNTGSIRLFQQPIETMPYINDFETQIDGWRHSASLGLDDWTWATPNGTILDSAFSGSKVWVTNDSGPISPLSRMHLYSPIFDLSTSAHPVVSFDLKMMSYPETVCNCYRAYMNMSYSTDGGATWSVLDKTNESYNRWYYRMDITSGADMIMGSYFSDLLFAPDEPTFATYDQFNGRDASRNTRYIVDASFLAGESEVQFRYNLGSSGNGQAVVEGAMVDNFALTEGQIDLAIPYEKSLLISQLTDEIRFFMKIKNQGNYFSNPSKVKYYLSTDPLLDPADHYLGDEDIPMIRPDLSHYVNIKLLAPPNLSSYQYLLYELDALDQSLESDELNNVGYWPLDMAGVTSYPYVMDFSDTALDGWHHYVHRKSGTHLKDSYRFRNIVAPAEALYQTGIETQQMFTDRISGVLPITQVPFWYLETPHFDFSTVDSLSLSFDLLCTGSISVLGKDGGNMEFSTDGGNSWTLLTDDLGSSHNWYTHPVLDDVNNEPGWAGIVGGTDGDIYWPDSTSFDISFLKGEEHVMFRYKYRSNWSFFGGDFVQGMRVDNFLIDGFTIDYSIGDSVSPIMATTSLPNFPIDYTLHNTGQLHGPITNTKFYWSLDSVLDGGDILIWINVESLLLSGETRQSSATITYPTLLPTQAVYYLFAVADGDSVIVESNEANNVFLYTIIFDINVSNAPSPLEEIEMYINDYTLILKFSDPGIASNYVLSVTTLDGKQILEEAITHRMGTFVFPLPDHLAEGMYLVSLRSKTELVAKKIVLQH